MPEDSRGRRTVINFLGMVTLTAMVFSGIGYYMGINIETPKKRDLIFLTDTNGQPVDLDGNGLVELALIKNDRGYRTLEDVFYGDSETGVRNIPPLYSTGLQAPQAIAGTVLAPISDPTKIPEYSFQGASVSFLSTKAMTEKYGKINRPCYEKLTQQAKDNYRDFVLKSTLEIPPKK